MTRFLVDYPGLAPIGNLAQIEFTIKDEGQEILPLIRRCAQTLQRLDFTFSEATDIAGLIRDPDCGGKGSMLAVGDLEMFTGSSGLSVGSTPRGLSGRVRASSRCFGARVTGAAYYFPLSKPDYKSTVAYDKLASIVPVIRRDAIIILR
ncbi:hypothetical protein GGI17_005850 [Coemansia sp. S146]|nr:hypothetical protein GGI17_005850 [Coemansia sp. S146]